jgi:Rab9 effector protein with kelch motifs
MPSPPPTGSPPQIKVAPASEQDAMSMSQHSSGALSDVPEDGPITTPRSPVPCSPYFSPTHQAAASTSTFHGASPPPGSSPVTSTNNQAVQSSSVSRKSSGSVRLGRDTTGSNGSLRKQALAPSRSSGSLAPPRDKKRSSADPGKPKIRILPRLPHSKDVELVPTTGMYWSKAPVYGHLPTRGLRANSTTLVDNVVWIFGGCDDTQCWNDVYCFDTGAVIAPYLQSYTKVLQQRLCGGPTHR